MADIYLNGKFIGTVKDASEFTNQVVTERRKGTLSKNINIYKDEELDQVFIECSKGRARRPLIVVKDGKPLLTSDHIKQIKKGALSWADLVEKGIIEYLDALEEENALVAFFESDLTKEHTHLQISPMDMAGICAGLVPYANHNQLTKVNAGAKNQKQGIGFYASNFAVRMDMDVNLLHTPQVPIVRTTINDISSYDKHPSGQNIVVAIMSYEGYNMEDSIIVNKGSIQRGMGRSSYFRPCVTQELRYTGGLLDEVSVPDKDVKGYRSEHDYRFLEEDGIVYSEAPVAEGDVVIGKTSPPRFLSGADDYNLTSNIRRESSISMKHGEQGVVDFVLLTENEEGNKLVQVRLRDQRIPEIGDKFTSRHGQKGVIGLIVNHTDVPYTANGITPDLIFSPHSVPSRMTMSHLIELVGGKVGALSGRFIDGTLFDSEPESALRKELLSMGFRENGTETMYSGITGERYKSRIFVGNQYYLKLKHMVANKIHSRARGPIQLLTRQPTEGRAKEGGLRLGEMEKDTFIAHGASLLLKERFDSDRTVVPICEKCGLVAVEDSYARKNYCSICGDDTNITKIEMSYAFKLFLDELKALGIFPKLNLKSKY
jgi:DNA-directed RNA polymerase subunit B'